MVHDISTRAEHTTSTREYLWGNSTPYRTTKETWEKGVEKDVCRKAPISIIQQLQKKDNQMIQNIVMPPRGIAPISLSIIHLAITLSQTLKMLTTL